MLQKKILVFLLTALLVIALLVGCSPTTSPSAGESEPNQ